jgi:hypothetical protein
VGLYQKIEESTELSIQTKNYKKQVNNGFAGLGINECSNAKF